MHFAFYDNDMIQKLKTPLTVTVSQILLDNIVKWVSLCKSKHTLYVQLCENNNKKQEIVRKNIKTFRKSKEYYN
jgi:hypothetical protein